MNWICAFLLYFFHFSLQFIFSQLSHSIARLIANCFLFFYQRKNYKKKHKGEKGGVYEVKVKVQFGLPISKIIPCIPFFFPNSSFDTKLIFYYF